MRLLLFNLATDLDDPALGFTTQWIEALARRAESIHVITMRAGRVEVPENVCVYSLGKERGYGEPRRAARFYRHLFHIMRNEKIDACFSHMSPIFTVMGAPVLRPLGIPIVTWFTHPSLTTTLKAAHWLSNRMVTSLETSYPYRHDRTVVLGHGIDTDLFAPADAPPQETPAVVLCPGRLSPVKDHATLIRAVGLLREQGGPAVKVQVVGDPVGPSDNAYAASLRVLVSELGLDEIVEFIPARPRDELSTWYNQSTAAVNLTPLGFGDKVALEAMSCARPCLVANPGFHATLGRYAEPLTFVHGDAEDLAGKLFALLTLPREEREEMGRYLRDRIVEMHSLDRLADRLMAVLAGQGSTRGVVPH